MISEIIITYEGKLSKADNKLKKRLDEHVIDANIKDVEYDKRDLNEEYGNVGSNLYGRIEDKAKIAFENKK